MSKKDKKGGLIPPGMPPPPMVDINTMHFYKEGWGNAWLVPEQISGNLVGKLLTLIESWGLPAPQERAVKNIVRNEVYNAFDNAWIIGEEDHMKLREKIFNFGQLSLGGLIPPNFPAVSCVGAQCTAIPSVPGPNPELELH